MKKEKVTMSWSGGKDSAFALYKVLASGQYDVVGLHTVVDEASKRVGLHGVRQEMISRQAEAMGLPIEFLLLTASGEHLHYETLMKGYYKLCKQHGITGVIFGDIFLEDLKHYRENLLKESTLKPIFPLWKIDSNLLVHDFVNAGFKTLICSANTIFFSEPQMGKTIDEDFLTTLPSTVDPCGENGEFHSYVYSAPLFKKPIDFLLGEVVKKSYSYGKQNDDGTTEKLESSFWFQDFMPRIAP